MEWLRKQDPDGASVFAETLADLKGAHIARKTKAMIRAYIQNAHLLKQHDCSLRAYLQAITPYDPFPPSDVINTEARWVQAIQTQFYNVGPALAQYMICDWLLWLWRAGQIDWFASYKPDSVHMAAVKTGKLPPEAGHDFASFCKNIIIPEGYGAVSAKPCPPRLLNACIWLEENKSSDNKVDQKPAGLSSGLTENA